MYAEYFGFSELPFTVTPDPHTFFDTPVYQDTFAALQYGVLAKKGFVVVTGEVGTGKTTLIRKLLHSLGPTVNTVFVFNTQVTFAELLRLILTDLNLPGNADKVTMIEILNEYLIDQLKQGHIVSLLIDEAQNLCGEALEGLRLLSNLETDTQKLLQIVLVGQPELETKLDRPELRQLKQRVSFHCRLTPLKREEVGAYIDFRLNAVGFRGKRPFNRTSVETIASYSKGIPRLINIICDNALLAAFAASKRKVSAQLVEEVARDFQLAPLRRIVAPQPTTNDVPESSVTPRNREEPVPEFENIFADAENDHRARVQQRRMLSGLGFTVFLGAVLLGSIAVYMSPPTKITVSDLATTWADFSREGKDYFRDWGVKITNFFERTQGGIAASALQAERLSVRTKEYLALKAAALNRRTGEYDAGADQQAQKSSPETTHEFVHFREQAADFYRRSKVHLMRLAARLEDGLRSDWQLLKSVPISNTPEDNSSKISPSDAEDVNQSGQSETSFGSTRTVAAEPALTGPEVIQQKENSPVIGAQERADTEPAKNTRPPRDNSVTGSQQPASFKTDPAQVERPNKPAPRYLGNFEVVANSYVRAKPQDDAEIIDTLEPGTRVRVENKTGRYFRVRSLSDSAVRGYVHEEDAFFQQGERKRAVP